MTDYDLYDGTPPHVADSDTSREAAESVADDVGRMASLVFTEVRRAGSHGATCDEIELALRMKHQTASARLRELALRGKVADSGRRRLTRSKRSARVYVATQEDRS